MHTYGHCLSLKYFIEVYHKMSWLIEGQLKEELEMNASYRQLQPSRCRVPQVPCFMMSLFMSNCLS